MTQRLEGEGGGGGGGDIILTSLNIPGDRQLSRARRRLALIICGTADTARNATGLSHGSTAAKCCTPLLSLCTPPFRGKSSWVL